MQYTKDKKPSHTKGESWAADTVRLIYREEFNANLTQKLSLDLALFLSLFWNGLKQERTYLNDVNIWNLTQEKRREIFLRGYEMWIMYKTSIDRMGLK